jgi:hypothetical protein
MLLLYSLTLLEISVPPYTEALKTSRLALLEQTGIAADWRQALAAVPKPVHQVSAFAGAAYSRKIEAKLPPFSFQYSRDSAFVSFSLPF